MRHAIWMAGCSLVACALVAPATAQQVQGQAQQQDTLREALATAYVSNPTLSAARAAQRATDETVPLARADGLPSAGVQGSYSENFLKSANSFTAPSRQASGIVQMTVPVYSGGSVRNAIKSARTRVEAGQADLRATESSLFANVVAAYMDVIRDEAIVALNRTNVRVLGVNLEASSDRYEIGDLTRTDVAQSEARLAIARSDLQSAEANLIRSKEIYIQLVGRAPGELQPPPPLPNLPESPELAVGEALQNNPDLIAAEQRRDAADTDVDAARGAHMPQVELYSQGRYTNYFNSLGSGTVNSTFFQEESTAEAGVRLTIPVYQGGRVAARVRQAQARESQAIETVIATERDVIAQTRAAYSSWRASLQVIESSQAAVDANSLALEGVRAENSVGNRTILDILDAERELLNAQVQLVTARRNAYVAGFSLLAAMGRAEAEDLGLDGGALYDPDTNYDRVDGKLFDWDTDPDPVPVATRTVDTQPQDATIMGPVDEYGRDDGLIDRDR